MTDLSTRDTSVAAADIGRRRQRRRRRSVGEEERVKEALRAEKEGRERETWRSVGGRGGEERFDEGRARIEACDDEVRDAIFERDLLLLPADEANIVCYMQSDDAARRGRFGATTPVYFITPLLCISLWAQKPNILIT